MSGRLEYCEICSEPTGKAGAGEDSIYWLDGAVGPLCENCNAKLRGEILDDVGMADDYARLNETIASKTEALSAARHMLEEIGSEIQQHYEYMSDNRPLPVLVSEILDNMEAARYDREQAEAKLSALYKGIRGLAMDSGAVQTDDAVDDVRRALEEKDAEIERLKDALQESEADNVRLRSEWIPPDAYAEERTAREQAEREFAAAQAVIEAAMRWDREWDGDPRHPSVMALEAAVRTYDAAREKP